MNADLFPYPIGRLHSQYQAFDLVIDSRLVGNPDKTLFFALRGDRRDGHEFIPQLLRLGVRHFVVAQERFPNLQEAIDEAGLGLNAPPPTFNKVHDPAETLRLLAAYHRRQFDIPVVAITGSNGKTIVKDWLAELLATEYEVCFSPRSYNSLIGVPLSVWQLRSRHQIAVFEVGISQPGDMEKLRHTVHPTHGILTNIGTAHLQNFTSRDALAREKLLLFENVQKLFIAASSDFLDQAREVIGSGEVVGWAGEGQVGVTVGGETWEIAYPPLPSVYLDNARMATVAADLFSVDRGSMQKTISRFVPAGNRLEQRQGRDGGNVINDTDNSAWLGCREDFRKKRVWIHPRKLKFLVLPIGVMINQMHQHKIEARRIERQIDGGA